MSGVALVSLYDRENNAVRQLGASLRARGHRVVEIYFKDWVNNRLVPPAEVELQLLVARLNAEGVDLVGMSLRASAYQRVARQVVERVRRDTQLPVVLGGWHVTVRPRVCIDFADALCRGEADASFPAFVARFFAGGGLDACVDSPGFWVRDSAGVVHENAPPDLVTDLDAIPWRDYTAAEKWCIHQGRETRGDPMADDPLHQVMCSIGCIQRCSFCHNSFDVGAAGPRLRFRSVDSVLAELSSRRLANPAIRRVRFDDEIFGLDKRWLREFADRYPVEVGLPFDVLTEPTVVSDEYAELLARAGARVVHMGIQSTEGVNRDQLERRASRAVTRDAVRRLSDRGIRIRYLVMVDIPAVSDDDKRELLEFLLDAPRPYDLYLFSLTWFPGSAMVESRLASGALLPSEVEGEATKTFSQYRVDLGWPRTPRDQWWIGLMVLAANPAVPRRLVRALLGRGWGQSNPALVLRLARVATLAKTASTAQGMFRDGELTATLVRRWWDPQRMITM